MSPDRVGVEREVTAFLVREADLLDERDLRGWLALLTEDIDYRIPIRVTRERASSVSPFSEDSFHMLEDWASLKARVDRFDTEFAWSEDPPSRTRRFVTNVFLESLDDDAHVRVRSNLLVYRARGDSAPQLLSGQRRDTLRRVSGEWRLATRLVLLDHTRLPTENLAIFL